MFDKKSLLPIGLSLIGLLLAYSFFIPHFIQGGDSAELVAAAHYNLVAHPPGYPLWTLLQQGWMKILDTHSLFWRASLLNTLFAVASLFFIILPIKGRKLLMAALLVLVAFTWTFFQAAVIPDVFALHALFTTVIIWLSIDEHIQQKYRSFFLSFLFVLSFSNHHTTIFLLPIVVQSFLNQYPKKDFVVGVILGSLITILLYLSLILRNPNSYYSWGNITDLKSLLAHFLRNDYGTFRLAANESSPFFNWDGIWKFFELNAIPLIFFIFLILFFVPFERKLYSSRKSLALLLTFFLSLSFLGLVNFRIEGMAEEIVSRFHVMPLIILMMFAVFLIAKSSKTPKRSIEILFLTLAIVSTLPTLYKNRDLAKDNIIESYARNLLNQAIHQRADAVLIENDNSYFALRLIQLEHPEDQSLAIISPPLLFHHWYYSKQQQKLEHLKFLNEAKVLSERKMDFIEDLLKPNTSHYKFFLTKNFQNFTDFKLTFLPLGRIIEKGQGLNLDESLTVDVPVNFNSQSIQGFSKKMLHAEYAHYYLAKGMLVYSQKQVPQALASWKKAISIVPYCLPAYQNICQLTPQDSSFCSTEKLESVKKEAHLIF